jgi:YD repeat-containing protein
MSGFRKFQYHDPVSTHITLPFTENESSFFWGNPANGGPLSTVNEGNYCSYLPSLSELILECKRVVRKSTPIQSTVKELSEAGNFFKHITELFGGNGENGKIEYTYGNGIVAGVRTHNDIGYLTNKDDKLVSKKVFARLSNGNFDLKSEELLEYGVPDDTDPNFYAGTTNSGKETRFWIKKVQKVRDDMQLACPSAGHYCFHKVFFETNARIAAVPLELRKRTLKQFENGQLQEDITHFFYESNLHGFATRVQTTNSKNEVIEKYLKFPPDVSGNSVFQSMSTKNQIGTPVEERLVRQIGNRELNKTELVYAGYNNGTHFLPSQVRTSVAGAPLETELSFEQYDAAGNLLQARDKAGIVTSYVWAYGNRLPAAKVVGATHSSLQSYVNTNSYGNIHDPAAIETGLAPLRNMPGAQASIYSYQPGVGMLATIDPRGVRSTYEYDGSGRLIAVRDHTGNIVRQMCYNYANQPVECTDLVTFTSLAAAFKNNTAYSGSFTRSCGAGANGSSVNYTVPVGSVVSYISQADANTKAQQKLQVLGQAYANIHGSCSTLPPTIYAVLSIENVSVGGTSTFGDVVLRFYADAAHTVPVSVTGLAVRIREQFHDNMNSTVNDAEFTVQANGSVFVALAGVELSSNDGWTTDWYKTFTLLTNPGYNF